MLGKIKGRLPAETPNQLAKVDAYWSTAVVGIQRPWAETSFGPPRTSAGMLPYIWPPFTASPKMKWWPPQAWSVPPPEAGFRVRAKSDCVNVVTCDETPSATVAL